MIFKLDLGDGITCTAVTKEECDEEGFMESVVWSPKDPDLTSEHFELYKKWFNGVNEQLATHFDCVIVHIYTGCTGASAFIFEPNKTPRPATKKELIDYIKCK